MKYGQISHHKMHWGPKILFFPPEANIVKEASVKWWILFLLVSFQGQTYQ